MARSLELASLAPAPPLVPPLPNRLAKNLLARNALGCETPRCMRFLGGAGVAGGAGTKCRSPVPRSSANHAIAEMERSPRKRGPLQDIASPRITALDLRPHDPGYRQRLPRSAQPKRGLARRLLERLPHPSACASSFSSHVWRRPWQGRISPTLPEPSETRYRLRQSAPPFQTRSASPSGKAKAAASARPRCRLRGRVGWRVGPEMGRGQVRPVTCMPCCSCAAGIRSDSGQNGYCDPHAETRPPGVFACDEIDTCGIFVTGQDTQALQSARGNEGTGDLPGRQAL